VGRGRGERTRLSHSSPDGHPEGGERGPARSGPEGDRDTALAIPQEAEAREKGRREEGEERRARKGRDEDDDEEEKTAAPLRPHPPREVSCSRSRLRTRLSRI